jgi:bacillithiol system protein YtxJ
VNVIENRDLSDEITRRTGVEHHTPEAVFIRNGTVSGFRTHFDITGESLEKGTAHIPERNRQSGQDGT